MCRLSWNLGASTYWSPLGLPRPVMGLLYLFTGLVTVNEWRSGMVGSYANVLLRNINKGVVPQRHVVKFWRVTYARNCDVGCSNAHKKFLQEHWTALWKAWNQLSRVRETGSLRCCYGRLDHRICSYTIRDTLLVHDRHQALISERDGHRGQLLACPCVRSMVNEYCIRPSKDWN
jgi:hypothetical protein